ncbi:MAG: hypothetical protein AAFP90_17560, partial [Planctomycetota bacterium]
TEPTAIFGLIAAILGFFMCFPAAIVAVVLGHIAVWRTSPSKPYPSGGRVLSIIALSLGYLSLLGQIALGVFLYDNYQKEQRQKRFAEKNRQRAAQIAADMAAQEMPLIEERRPPEPEFSIEFPPTFPPGNPASKANNQASTHADSVAEIADMNSPEVNSPDIAVPDVRKPSLAEKSPGTITDNPDRQNNPALRSRQPFRGRRFSQLPDEMIPREPRTYPGPKIDFPSLPGMNGNATPSIGPDRSEAIADMQRMAERHLAESQKRMQEMRERQQQMFKGRSPFPPGFPMPRNPVIPGGDQNQIRRPLPNEGAGNQVDRVSDSTPTLVFMNKSLKEVHIDQPFTPDGKYFITIDKRIVHVHATGSGESLATVPALSETDAPLRAATFTHSGKQIVTGYRDGQLRLWDVETSADSAVRITANPTPLQARDDSVDRLWVGRAADYIVDQSRSKNLRWQSLRGRGTPRSSEGLPGRRVVALRTPTSGTRMLAVNTESVNAIDLRSGQSETLFRRSSIRNAAISHDGRRVIVCSPFKKISMIRSEDGSELWQIAITGTGAAARFSPDDQWVIVQVQDECRVLSAENGTLIAQWSAKNEEGISGTSLRGAVAHLSPDKQHVHISSRLNTILYRLDKPL